MIDSPAGINGAELRVDLRRADALVVPISPSVFDMAATARFLDTIADTKEVKERALPVAVVAMRVDARTKSAAELDAFLEASRFRPSRTRATRRPTFTARATVPAGSIFPVRAASRIGNGGGR